MFAFYDGYSCSNTVCGFVCLGVQHVKVQVDTEFPLDFFALVRTIDMAPHHTTASLCPLLPPPHSAAISSIAPYSSFGATSLLVSGTRSSLPVPSSASTLALPLLMKM